MEKIREIMFALLRFVFCGVQPEITELTGEEGKKLYIISKKQDISHIICLAIEKAGIVVSDDVKELFRKQKMTAVYRCSLMEEELKKISELFESEQIKYMPLKGMVIKRLYPEEWMRTSSDIDILVSKDDMEQAGSLIKSKLGYIPGDVGSHDEGFKSPSGVHFELHFRLIEDIEAADKILSHVWESAVPTKDKNFEYEMSDELFYYYHVAHIAKHFKNGGCGVKNFIDLWLLNNRCGFDEGKRKEILERGSLLKFDETIRNLADSWFSKEEKSGLANATEGFVISGGTYGNIEQHVTVKQNERNGKIGYFISRIFVSRAYLELLYPNLKKRPALLPYYEMVRWCNIFIPRRRTRIKKEIKINLSMEKEKKDAVDRLFKELGI